LQDGHFDRKQPLVNHENELKMATPILFAATATWVSNWLTPIWLIGIGALLGLAVLSAIWVLVSLVSRLAFFEQLEGDVARRNRLGVGVSLIVFVVLGALALGPTLWGSDPANAPISRQDAPMAACLIAVLSWLIGFAMVKLMSRRVAAEVVDAVREGPLWPIFLGTALLAVFGVIGYFIATTPQEILASLVRLPSSGKQRLSYKIPAAPEADWDDPSKDPPQHPIDISFRPQELQSFEFRSDQNLTIDVRSTGDVDLTPLFRIDSGEDMMWRRNTQTTLIAEEKQIEKLFVRNYGRAEATLAITLVTAPKHPEVITCVITAGAVIGVFLLYLLQRAALPRLSAVALAAYKSEIAQPLFLIVLAIGLFAVVAFIWIPYNTLGEDIKVLKDTGMTLIMILSIIQAVWAASTSVADEIEGRTALTVLSKPIGRRSFICGKYMGIFWTVAVIFVVLSTAFMVSVSYKPIYDNKEGGYKPVYEDRVTSGDEEVTWQQCHYEVVGVVPGLVLAFLETIVLAALSVAISTRLPMLANFIICFSIYVLGHLTPLIVQSSVGKFPPVRFVAELLSTVLPILDHFNIQAAVSTGATVPYDYLGWTLLYSMLYGVMALLLALVLFEDRDLA
jgi:ABC-type transport system involved in multi-copper enzyme maturation permease subunit